MSQVFYLLATKENGVKRSLYGYSVKDNHLLPEGERHGKKWH